MRIMGFFLLSRGYSETSEIIPSSTATHKRRDRRVFMFGQMGRD